MGEKKPQMQGGGMFGACEFPKPLPALGPWASSPSPPHPGEGHWQMNLHHGTGKDSCP